MKRADDDDDGDLGKSCGEWWLVVVVVPKRKEPERVLRLLNGVHQLFH